MMSFGYQCEMGIIEALSICEWPKHLQCPNPGPNIIPAVSSITGCVTPRFNKAGHDP